MYYVYILRSNTSPEKYYIGCTEDLNKRLLQHNSGESIHTNKHKPWVVAAYVAILDQDKAYDFERYLKSRSGRAILIPRLIAVHKI